MRVTPLQHTSQEAPSHCVTLSLLISDQDLSDHCSLYHCDRVVSLVTGWSVEWLHPHVMMCECDVIQRGRFLWVTPLPWIMAGCATTGDGIGTAFQ